MNTRCFRANLTSPLKDKLSQIKTLAPATMPAGNVLSWLFLSPNTQQ